MKIVTWNCLRAFRRKAAALEPLNPDIAVIAECESTDRLRAAGPEWSQRSICWHGEDPTKGLGVIGFSDYQISIDPSHDPTIKYVVPLRVTGPRSFNLLAVWTKEDPETGRYYLGQALEGIRTYAPFLAETDSVVAGDFNSNQGWYEPDFNPHEQMVEDLSRLGLTSVYHHHFREAQGRESRHTYYWNKQQARPFHIDFCFVPTAWLPFVRSVTVGDHKTWSQWSDHSPLAVEFDFTRKAHSLRGRLAGALGGNRGPG